MAGPESEYRMGKVLKKLTFSKIEYVDKQTFLILVQGEYLNTQAGFENVSLNLFVNKFLDFLSHLTEKAWIYLYSAQDFSLL